MNDAERDELIAAALTVRDQAYAPYSRFLVGAALRATDGRVFAGCNVENASYGLTICAERVAAAAAVAAGAREFSGLALATAGGHRPCGACRQFLAEFAPRLPIAIVDVENVEAVEETDLGKLLPEGFGGERMKDER